MSLICPYYEPTPSRSTPRAKQHKQKCITHMFMRKKKKHTSHMCRYTTRKAARVIFFAMQSKKIARKHFDTARNAACVIFFFYAVKYKLRVNIFVPQLRDARWTAWHDARVVCNQVWRTVAQKPLANVDAYVYVRMLCMHIILCIYIFNNVYI